MWRVSRSVGRVLDDCTTRLESCYFTDDVGAVQSVPPGGTFSYAADTWTFKPDCTFDAASGATTTPPPPVTTAATTQTTNPTNCPVTLRDGSTYDAFPGEEFGWYTRSNTLSAPIRTEL